MENLTFKLYSPLTAEFLPDDNRFWQEDELVELSGYELADYAAAISEQIEREGDHLEQYLDAETEPYLASHVKIIRSRNTAVNCAAVLQWLWMQT